MIEVKIKAGSFAERFLNSTAKFPCLVGGVGCGKTLLMLLKIYKYCEEYPGSTALIIRREYSDLKDSTVRDFERYFEVKIDSFKNYVLPNRSTVLFRHGDEMAVLRNLNISIAGMEQGEEFPDDEAFNFLRDRLRQENGASARPLLIIANSNAHNWIWNKWVSGKSCRTIDAATGQFEFTDGQGVFHCLTANSFANAANLPPDFVEDLKRKEVDAPSHYRRYVLNSFEETEADDTVFTFQELQRSRMMEKEIVQRDGFGTRIMGFDVARYGEDKCAAVGIEQVGALTWRTFHVEQWGQKDLDYSTGRILATSSAHNADYSIIDEDGMGSGPVDFILRGRRRNDFQGFRNIAFPADKNKDFCNPRTEACFKLKEMVSRGRIVINDEMAIQELLTLKYKFANDGRRILVSKEELRKKGIKSPNLADALLMAVSVVDSVQTTQDSMYSQRSRPTQYPDADLFRIAGIR